MTYRTYIRYDTTRIILDIQIHSIPSHFKIIGTNISLFYSNLPKSWHSILNFVHNSIFDIFLTIRNTVIGIGLRRSDLYKLILYNFKYITWTIGAVHTLLLNYKISLSFLNIFYSHIYFKSVLCTKVKAFTYLTQAKGFNSMAWTVNGVLKAWIMYRIWKKCSVLSKF